MSIVVAFDGSDLSRSALQQACEVQELLDEELVVVTAIPSNNATYAREHGWIEAGEDFDGDEIKSKLQDEVENICQGVQFKPIVVGKRPSKGGIANKIRKAAKSAGATMVVLGSDNAGRIVTSLSSVGGGIATDTSYDVLIVRS
jgi:nucleotide-binding universal stress UspA family protein